MGLSGSKKKNKLIGQQMDVELKEKIQHQQPHQKENDPNLKFEGQLKVKQEQPDQLQPQQCLLQTSQSQQHTHQPQENQVQQQANVRQGNELHHCLQPRQQQHSPQADNQSHPQAHQEASQLSKVSEIDLSDTPQHQNHSDHYVQTPGNQPYSENDRHTPQQQSEDHQMKNYNQRSDQNQRQTPHPNQEFDQNHKQVTQNHKQSAKLQEDTSQHSLQHEYQRQASQCPVQLEHHRQTPHHHVQLEHHQQTPQHHVQLEHHRQTPQNQMQLEQIQQTSQRLPQQRQTPHHDVHLEIQRQTPHHFLYSEHHRQTSQHYPQLEHRQTPQHYLQLEHQRQTPQLEHQRQTSHHHLQFDHRQTPQHHLQSEHQRQMSQFHLQSENCRQPLQNNLQLEHQRQTPQNNLQSDLDRYMSQNRHQLSEEYNRHMAYLQHLAAQNHRQTSQNHQKTEQQERQTKKNHRQKIDKNAKKTSQQSDPHQRRTSQNHSQISEARHQQAIEQYIQQQSEHLLRQTSLSYNHPQQPEENHRQTPQKPQLPLEHLQQLSDQQCRTTPQPEHQRPQQQQPVERHGQTPQREAEAGGPTEKSATPVEVKTEVVDEEEAEPEVEDIEDVEGDEEIIEEDEERIDEEDDVDNEVESLGESVAQLSEEYFTDDASDYAASPMPRVPTGIPGKVFHDCVHGSMWLHPLCVKLMDTLEFQRLRNIKQLGLAYLVYPGAGHNRFEHSLGVCYLSSRMLEALEQNSNTPANERIVTEEEALCVQVAGLCHDLGHGPFSHTWENFVNEYDPSWKHEMATLMIFDELANRLDDDFKMFGLDDSKKKLIKEMIIGGALSKTEPLTLNADKYFMYEIIANKTNDIDVDKWEYLARDAAQLGVPVAFQSKRLFEFCRVGYVDGDDRSHIIIRDKEAITVFAMFQARSELHYFAYQHRVVMSLEEMLLDALREADRAGYTYNGYKLSEIHKSAQAYVTLNDSIFYNLLYSQEEFLATSRRLLSDICERKIYEFVCLKHISPDKIAEHIELVRNQTKDETEMNQLLLKSFVAYAKDCIRETRLLTDDQVDSLIYKKIEMKVRHAPESSALDTVYVYSKFTPEKGIALKNWKNVPIYPIDVEKMCHIDILILTRTKLSDSVLKKLRETSDQRLY